MAITLLQSSFEPCPAQALSLEPLKIDKIAVLLPLSGRLANQGLAIKEGILAAYLHNLPKVPQPLGVDSPALVAQHNAVAGAPAVPAKQQLKVISGTLPKEDRPQQIRFFDSASKSPEEMNDLLSDYDLIIGPLLKEKVSALLELLPANKPILALNRIEPSAEATVVPVLKQIGSSAEPTLQLEQEQDLELEKKEVYYFALDPEDEAQHIARHLREQGFKRPIIFSATGHTTQRMADAFIHAWKASDKSPVYIAPDLAIFTNSKDMRRQVSRLLDVSQSKTRIKQLERLATVEVYAVERNRRDIDAIVLFANPIQTELLNPIIESSLSPFARKTLSVFASSRSYSMDLSKNNLRDLRNLSFSDMPWTLPNHPWPALATRTATLWPQRQGNLLRLFALGYDAYQVLPKLRHLSLAQHSSIKGLTGELSMDSEGQLHRRLSWAKIVQDRVTLLAMD
jgi:outer membrane PBP1 activator LpoA protein